MQAAEMAAAAAEYRKSRAALVKPGAVSVLPYRTGCGSALMAAEAAVNCGAVRALFIIPKSAMEAWAAQLSAAGYDAAMAPAGRDAAAAICRDAMLATGDKLRITIAAPSHVSAIGHWLEAWPDKCPFDFVAVAEPGMYAGSTSERGRGMGAILGRAATAALLCSSADPLSASRIDAMAASWGASLCGQAGPGA